ncbi:TLR4 interactor with leucine rich repeats [Scleropages formosus]|uniref:TLR4 interactor with leucine rich repeats n=1 Tax=Scleropages formosus TaxID=113540 RepID=UPI0010FA6D54|nr:TLR4 interactor with leucine rich repeats [Scleropages formosus]
MARVLPLCFVLACGALCAGAVCPERCDCPHARHLLCANRGLRAVPRTPARDLDDVLVFSLGGNYIHNISALDFARFRGLKRLDLQYNQIRVIHPRAFEKLSKLEELYLGNNQVSAIAPGTLRSLSKLRVLYGNSNDIRKVGAECFGNLRSVVKLRLDSNAIEVLPDAVFGGLSGLLYLHLESNKVRLIHGSAFRKLHGLRFLNLSGNKQRSLRNISTFASLGSLTTLLLSDNEIQYVGDRVFQSLRKLTKLSLSNNRVRRLEPEALEGLSALRELLLDGNELSDVPPRLLDPLQSVEVLDLSRNRISSVEPTAFQQLGHLKVLKLEKNQLSSLSGGVFALNGALHNLYLNDNDWTCDCRLLEFKRWMNEAHAQGRLLTVFVQCQHPGALKGRYLDYLNGSQLHPPGNSSHQPCEAPQPAESLAGGLLESPFPGVGLSIQADQGGSGQPKKSHAEKNKRKKPVPRTGSSTGDAGTADRGRALSSSPGNASKKGQLPTKSPFAAPKWHAVDHPVSTVSSPIPDRAETFDLLQQDHVALAQVTDPCQFNRHFIVNVTVHEVSSSTATIRWSIREHGDVPDVHFRVLFDRFGQAVRFPRFVYVQDRGRMVTLHELVSGATYLVCVEGVVDGAVCQVASRDHCTGVVTLHAGRSGADLQLVTMVMLGVNALLLLLVGAAWAGRYLRRRLRHRKSAVHVRHMYSTRRSLRTMAPAVSNDFTSYQTGRPRMCPIDEGDLIEFPCDRFLDSSGTRRDEASQRFPD